MSVSTITNSIANATISSSSSLPTSNEVHLVSLGYGELRLAKQYCEKKTLEDLFQTEDGIIVVDSQGEEIFVDKETNLYPLEPEQTYTVVSEKDLESDTEDDDDVDDQDDIDDDDVDYEDEDETITPTTTTTTTTIGDQVGSQLKEETSAHTHTSTCCQHDHHSSCAHEEETEQEHEHHSCCQHDHDNDEIVVNEPQHNHTLNNQVYLKLLRMREARIEMISRLYKRLHPEIFTLQEEFF